MKTHLFRISSILAVLVLLVAVSLSSTAQETTRRQQPTQQEERQLRELAVQELDAETRQIKVPVECQRIRPVVQTHNGGTGVSPSPGLLSFMGTHARKGYNNPAVNTYFGDSFKLQSCRVCYATIEAKVEHYGDVWSNDSLTVGAAPFALSDRFVSGYIWQPLIPNPGSLNWVVPAGLLNTYLMSNPPPPKYLDVYSQDDTDFHSTTLTVWYY
jgi:hypothetical protein